MNGRYTGASEEVGTRDDLRAAVFGFGDVGEIVVAGEEEDRKTDVLRRVSVR